MSTDRPPERPMAREPAPRTPDADDCDHAEDENEREDAAQVFALRQQYWLNGYRPVPIYSRQKRPRGNGWLADALQDPPLWATRWPEIVALSTGLATGPLAGFDVDVMIQGIVDRIVWETEHLLGTTPLVRIGRAPKTLLAFRCDQPFRKLSTGTFIMPEGSEAKVEMLADGQQFVADGIHPDTGQPYLWPAGSPETVPLADVPPITLEQAQALIAKSRELLIANGGVEKKPPSERSSPRPQQAVHGAAGADSFFAAVNEAALRNLAAWVKTLFPRATYQLGTGAWRVASKDRGRPELEEDISLHPGGIQDFGCEQGLTPIDVAIEFGNAADAVAAAHWLCERLGIQPATLGWQQRDTPRPQPEPQPHPGPAPDDDTNGWPEPVDFMSATDLGAPILTERHVPPALWPFISDNAERMGVATSSVALCSIVSCSAAINEEWKLQPKRNDWDWTEAARLWGAVVGPPSVLKSPVIAATTQPVELLDIRAHDIWSAAQKVYEAATAAWKDGGKLGPEPRLEPCDRYLVESVTIEALSEVLRADAAGKLRAPLGKVLCRQDELSEFLGNMDKYTSGKGNSDRPAWLRAYNGGRHVIDRIGRGSFPIKSWSCCLLGGIQPDVIRRIVKQGDDDGLIQRLVLDVPGPQAPGLDRAPDRAARDHYRALFPALAALHPARTGEADNTHLEVVTLQDAAQAAREDIEGLARVMQAMPDASPRLQTSFGKWPGLFGRLALTFHLVEAAASRVRNPGGQHPPLNIVTTDTAERVCRYMRGILAPSLRRADAMMFATAQTEHASSIARCILAERLDQITMRDLMRYGPLALRPPEERPARDSVMEGLCLFGWLRPVLREAQPTITWIVNPGVHALYAERAEAERIRRAAMADTMARAFSAKRAEGDC